MRLRRPSIFAALALITLAGCGAPGAGGGLSAGGGDPERVVVVKRSFGSNSRDPQSVQIYETEHSFALAAQSWATHPGKEVAESLISSARIHPDGPNDSEQTKQFNAKRRAQRDEAQAALPAAFDLWQKGQFSAAFTAFRNAAENHNGDNPLVWFYLAESAYKINRFIDSFLGYRNTIALSPGSKEGLAAKGRIEEFFTNPVGGLREPVFEAATDNELCMSKFLRFDQMRNAGYAAPSARGRYHKMMRALGASNAQADVALNKYDSLAKRELANVTLVRVAIESQLSLYRGFLPSLGYAGIDDPHFDSLRAQCPLGLIIKQTKYWGKPVYQVAKKTYTGDPTNVISVPEVTFGRSYSVEKEDQVEMP
jgi:tetratricopeptide (TPR) repeat protein